MNHINFRGKIMRDGSCSTVRSSVRHAYSRAFDIKKCRNPIADKQSMHIHHYTDLSTSKIGYLWKISRITNKVIPSPHGRRLQILTKSSNLIIAIYYRTKDLHQKTIGPGLSIRHLIENNMSHEWKQLCT